MKISNDSPGFTLIELMVVIVISAILATGAANTYQKTQKSANLDSKANEIFYALQRAKAEAAVRGVAVGCSFVSNGLFCFTRQDSLASSPTNAADNNGDGLLDSNAGDVAELIIQLRLNKEVFITDPVPAEGVHGTATGTDSFFFLSDGSVIDALNQPAGLSYALKLGSVGNQLAWNANIRLRPTGVVRKEL